MKRLNSPIMVRSVNVIDNAWLHFTKVCRHPSLSYQIASSHSASDMLSQVQLIDYSVLIAFELEMQRDFFNSRRKD